MIMDENGESHTPPVPDPVLEKYFVKKGDRVNEFEVSEITTNFLVLKSFIEYTEDMSSERKTMFIIEKGESINLTMYGVYDAVHKVSIRYI